MWSYIAVYSSVSGQVRAGGVILQCTVASADRSGQAELYCSVVSQPTTGVDLKASLADTNHSFSEHIFSYLSC